MSRRHGRHAGGGTQDSDPQDQGRMSRRRVLAGAGILAGAAIVAEGTNVLLNGHSQSSSSRRNNNRNGNPIHGTPNALKDRKLLVVSDETGKNDIWERDINSGHRRNLTNGMGNFWNPRQLDGESRVVVTTDALSKTGVTHIAELDLVSSSLRQITHGDRYWWDVAPMPNGLLVAKQATKADQGGHLILMDRNGSNQRDITPDLPPYLEAWAPDAIDSERIAFGLRDNRPKGVKKADQIAVLNVSTGEYDVITHGVGEDSWFPAVNSEAKRIAYVLGSSIVTMSYGGEDLQTVSPDIGVGFADPSWYGDGIICDGQTGNSPYDTYYLADGGYSIIDRPGIQVPGSTGDTGPRILQAA